MRAAVVTLMALVGAATPLGAQTVTNVTNPPPPVQAVSLSGPRFGFTSLSLLVPAIVSAQPKPSDASCTPVVKEVVVTARDGAKQKDTLLCMSTAEIVLVKGGTVALDQVRRIEEPADGILDGVLKGAAFGLVILAFCVNDCEVSTMLRATAAYATAGGIIDALDRNHKPIYSGDRTVGLAWKVRF